MLEIVVVPVCFLGAGLVGYRLGTPARVAGGLVALGAAHLLAFLVAWLAVEVGGGLADWTHLASQLFFVGGFVALVWLAAVYPDGSPGRGLLLASALLAVAGPLLAATSGPTPSVIDAERELGPITGLLPADVAGASAVPLMFLPLLAVVIFAVRYRRADAEARAAMRWPIAGVGVIAVLVVVGTLLGPRSEGLVTALFLLAAPVFPLAVAFGPVIRRIESLSGELAEVRQRLGRQVRPEAPPGVLGRLTPRELTVLAAMAEGKSNPLVAQTLHLSLSAVEKHVTSIFRKLELAEAPDTHRRVAAVIAYRDALEAARDGDSA